MYCHTMFNTAQLGGAVKILGTIAARSYGTYDTGALRSDETPTLSVTHDSHL